MTSDECWVLVLCCMSPDSTFLLWTERMEPVHRPELSVNRNPRRAQPRALSDQMDPSKVLPDNNPALCFESLETNTDEVQLRWEDGGEKQALWAMRG